MTLTGDDAGLLAALQRELSGRGISTAPVAPRDSACPSGRARVGRKPSGITLQIEDRYGRSSERTVDRPDAAAAVIASWTRDDLGAGLLAGHDLAAPPATAAAVAIAAAPAPVSGAATGAPPLGVGVTGEGTVDGNGALWLGARAEVCLRIGPLCGGPAVRVAEGTGPRSRREVDGLVAVSVPVRFGALTVMPGGEAGLGRRWNSYGPPMFVQEGASSTSPRFGVRVAAGYRVARLVSLEAAVGLGWTPWAEWMGMQQNEQFVAGEPRLSTSVGLGLRVGGP